jgi:hypothetical protein
MAEQDLGQINRPAGVGREGAWWRVVVVVACLLLSCILFVRHAWSVAQRRNALDQLGAGLADVRALVPDGKLLGFASDVTGDDRKELLHRAQFMLAPRVLDQAAGITDTILVINGDTWLAAQPSHAVLVDARSGSDRIMLIELRHPR